MKIIQCQKPTICLVKKTYDVSLRVISNNDVSDICLHGTGKATSISVKLSGFARAAGWAVERAMKN